MNPPLQAVLISLKNTAKIKLRISIVTLHNVCSVPWGAGGGAQYRGGVQYRGGYHEYRGGYLEYHGGYHDKCGGS